MIKPKKLNKGAVESLSLRLKDEQTAYRLYRYFSNCLRNSGYLIAAKYFEGEAMEELEHAHILEKYATDWNTELEFLTLETPAEADGMVEIFEASYTLEYNLLQEYSKNAVECLEDGDMSTFNFLQQFIAIQTKAVAEYADKLNMLELFDQTDKNWLFNFEKKLVK